MAGNKEIAREENIKKQTNACDFLFFLNLGKKKKTVV